MRHILFPANLVVLTALIAGSGSAQAVRADGPAQSAAKANEPKWQSLFDGKTLGKWKATEFGGGAEVKVEDGKLILPAGNDLTGVTWDGEPPFKINYEIDLEASRVDGSDFFCGLTFPVGDAHASLILGGWGGSLCGISSFDGEDAAHNDSSGIHDFDNRKWYSVRMIVIQNRLQAYVGKELIVDAGTKGRKIDVRAEVRPSRPLGIATYQTTGAIRNLRIRPLSSDEIDEIQSASMPKSGDADNHGEVKPKATTTPGATLVAKAATQAAAQPAAGGRLRVRSPEVSADGHATLRLYAPKASAVSAVGLVGNHPMTRGEDGVWSVTVGPLSPDIYEYSFNVDGLVVADPLNPKTKTQNQNFLTIPATPPAVWEARPVPHGEVHIHLYESKSLGATRRMHVYTPPGFDPKAGRRYPVLYLLHGSGDDDSGWVDIGRANLILDNLLAEGKVKPMIVVMPNGHVPRDEKTAATTKPAEGGAVATTASEAIRRLESTPMAWVKDFQSDLMQDVIPLVEQRYPTEAAAGGRAIAGLSMGGAQSMRVGLTHPDDFAYVVMFSAGGRAGENFDQSFPDTADGSRLNSRFKLLWIGCGKADGLVKFSRDFVKWLDAHHVTHEYVESEGSHDWRVWRRYLADITPLLFK